ncbi:MAG: hypothetical protein IPI22_05955 [Bacteroidetes bacterium]|nr:hypothetical protein [Bacteroidota bacterium]
MVFTGNEHTSNCKSVQLGSIYTSDCGTLTSIKHGTTFKVYPIIINDDIILGIDIYALQKTNGNDVEVFWNPRKNNLAKQPEKFEIYVKKSH